jgi:hypothetical protein
MKYLTGDEWRKSSYSGNSGNCVEVRAAGQTGTVAVRDSKHVPGPELTIAGDKWAAFVRGIKRGHFDLA